VRVPATSRRHQRCSADSGPNAGLSDSPSGRLTRHSTSLGASSHLGQPKERDTPNALDKAYPTTQIQPSNPEGPEVVHLRVSFTKELDGDTGLVYMYQRWYSGETGTFMSSAPRRVYREHRFSVARQHPVQRVDPFGTEDTTVGELIPELICALAAGAAYALSWADWKENDKLKHCIASCEIAKQCGALAAYLVGANKEGLDIFTGRVATEYDLNANNVGLDLACRGEDCVEGCHDAKDAGQLPNEPPP